MIIVEMKQITKRFPGVLANDQVDLALNTGEIHGLLGENGAGKTTLMNILFGLYQPDSGEILVNSQPVVLHSPADAIARGIGMVHQHFKLVPPFTVTENVILGLGGRQLVDMKAAQDKVAQVAEHYGFKIDPAARVQSLSVGEQQRVEILSSLYRGAEVLILDEPTAVLTPQEAEILAECLQKMAEKGKSIVFISHKLEEVLKLTGRITVLRAGKVVFSAMTKDTNKPELAHQMIGRKLASLRSEQRALVLALAGDEEVSLGEEPVTADSKEGAFLQVHDLHVNDDRNLPAVCGISFQVHSGEILGIAGVDGNGQRELVEAIARLRPIVSGSVLLNNMDAVNWNTRNFIENQAAYITDDRQSEGLVLDFNLSRNATLKVFERPPFSRYGLLNQRAAFSFTNQLLTGFDVRAPSPFVKARTLSGGNQQKLILARELSQSPRLIIANKPTRGLDIGAAAYIHQKLLDERAKGTALLLVSADLDEILMLSDRILVIFNGLSMGELEARSADVNQLGMMMAGTPLRELIQKETSI